MLRFFIFSVLFLTSCLLRTREEVTQREKSQLTQQQVVEHQQNADRVVWKQDVDSTLRSLIGRVEALEHRMNTAFDYQRTELEDSKKSQNVFMEEMRSIDGKLNEINQRLDALEKRKRGVEKKSAKKTTWSKAEEFFKSKQWKKAIVAYQEYRTKNPKGRFWASATYKIGVCFQELGLKLDAKSFYQEVVESQPKSRVARNAQNRLKQLE